MEFKRINENTFECLMSKEDLEDYDMTMEDFLENQDKTLDFMGKILERSAEELNFEAPPGVMSMQVSPLPGDGLSLVFTNRQYLTGLDFLAHITEIIRSHIEGLALASRMDESEASPQPVFDASQFLGNGAQVDGAVDAGKATHKRAEGKERSVHGERPRLYYFLAFKDLERFCKAWAGKAVKSQILKRENEEGYYLIVEKGRLSKADYACLMQALSEYSIFVTDELLCVSQIKEHAKVVVAKDAINFLRNL